MISDGPLDVRKKHIRKKYLTPDVIWYRSVAFITFYVKTHNYLRWNVFVRDHMRIGDGYYRRNQNMISFKHEHLNMISGEIAPFPADYLEYLPELN